MVSVGFTVFKDKIKNGTKKQTIRHTSKKWINLHYEWFIKGKKFNLQLYWHLRQKDCEFLSEENLKSIHLIHLLEDFTEEMAKADGFESKEQGLEWFKKTYPKDWNITVFYVIRWE